MKKCNGCDQEIDKYAIACQYCGKLSEKRGNPEGQEPSEEKTPEKKPEEQKES